jgi:hypothetical protein
MSTAKRHRRSAPRRQIVAYLVVISRPGISMTPVPSA